MVKPGSMTNRNRLGFDFPGSNPLAARRRVENLSGFLLSGRCFVLVRCGRDTLPADMLDGVALGKPRRTTLRWLREYHGISAAMFTGTTGYSLLDTSRQHKAPAPVRARIDVANGPAWAALKKHASSQRKCGKR